MVGAEPSAEGARALAPALVRERREGAPSQPDAAPSSSSEPSAPCSSSPQPRRDPLPNGRVPLRILSVQESTPTSSPVTPAPTTSLIERLIPAANEAQTLVTLEPVLLATGSLSAGSAALFSTDGERAELHGTAELRRDVVRLKIDAVIVDAHSKHLPRVLRLLRAAVGGLVAIVALVRRDEDRQVCLACMRSGADALVPQPLSAEALASLWQHCLRLDPDFFGPSSSDAPQPADARASLADTSRSRRPATAPIGAPSGVGSSEEPSPLLASNSGNETTSCSSTTAGTTPLTLSPMTQLPQAAMVSYATRSKSGTGESDAAPEFWGSARRIRAGGASGRTGSAQSGDSGAVAVGEPVPGELEEPTARDNGNASSSGAAASPASSLAGAPRLFESSDEDEEAKTICRQQ